MDRNFKLYRAAGHIIESAKYLRTIEPDFREQLLEIAEKLLDRIEIDEDEIRKIEEYEEKIKQAIKG